MKLSSTDKGALVALANLVTVAVCCGIMFGSGTTEIEWNFIEHFNGVALGAIIMNLALWPSLIVGVGLGKLAGLLEGSPQQRYAWLALAALGSVGCFGVVVGWVQVIPYAALPTLVWTWRLERWTRRADQVPAARAA